MQIRSLMLNSFVFSAALCIALPQIHAESEKDDAKKTENAQPEKSEKSEKPEKDENKFALPEEPTLENLSNFIEETQKTRPTSVEELMAMQSALDEAATKILAMKDVPVAEAGAAFEVRMTALQWKTRFGDKSAADARKELAEKYKNDERPLIASLAKNVLLQTRIQAAPKLSKEDRNALINDVFADAEKDGLSMANFRPAYMLAQTLERSPASDAAAAIYERLAKLARTSEDEQLSNYAETFQGTARRLGLLGNTMELKGKTVEDKPFNWESYRGKVVLVDFWATWCGPCIAEIPNMMKHYEAYHDKGFEIVGINQDENIAAVQKFLTERELPWTTVWAEGQPNAEYYGINAIPTMILVDRDGKVVELQARGQRLDAKLRELLGPPKTDEDEAKDEAKDQAKTEAK